MPQPLLLVVKKLRAEMMSLLLPLLLQVVMKLQVGRMLLLIMMEPKPLLPRSVAGPKHSLTEGRQRELGRGELSQRAHSRFLQMAKSQPHPPWMLQQILTELAMM
jgi:hypothetical protein